MSELSPADQLLPWSHEPSHSNRAGQLPGHQLGSQQGSVSQNRIQDAYEPTRQATSLKVLHTEYLKKQAQKC